VSTYDLHNGYTVLWFCTVRNLSLKLQSSFNQQPQQAVVAMDKKEQIKEIMPKSGLVYSEK
jgi:hypothetical protein